MIGDGQQIGSIGPGGLFAYLCRLTEPIRLTVIGEDTISTLQGLLLDCTEISSPTPTP